MLFLILLLDAATASATATASAAMLLLLLLLPLLLLQLLLLLLLLLDAATVSVIVAAMIGATRRACSCVHHIFCVHRSSEHVATWPVTLLRLCFSISSSICSC